jgi:hypothetical protein
MERWNRPQVVALSCVLASACGGAHYGAGQGAPSLVVPMTLAEGNTGKPALDADAGAAVSRPGPGAKHPSPPDPDPIRTERQFRYDLVYEKGAVRVAAVHRVVLERKAPTPRRLGRFAIELWLGKELVDRVRFDFPLLAGDPLPSQKHGSPGSTEQPTRFAPGAVTSQSVLVPDADRATSALLFDRLTGVSTPLAWPPEVADAGG